MDVTSASAITSTAGPGQTTQARSAISSDFETFLKMLTTQMQNQDPLNPVDSSDFAVQLATFSGVEQQVRTNQLLESLGAGLGMSGIGQYAGWVGMEARVVAPVAFTGQPVTLAPEAATGADRAMLVTLDAQGSEVLRQAVPVAGGTFEWAGLDASGSPLPGGYYSFRMDSYAGDTLLDSNDVAAYARVTEVRSGTGGPVAVLGGGIVVPTSDISALREPSG